MNYTLPQYLLFFSLTCVLALSSCGGSGGSKNTISEPDPITFDAGLHDLSIEHNGRERSCLVYIPEIAAAQAHLKRPVIFMLHGGVGDPDRSRVLTNYGFESIADSEDAIIVYPAGIEKQWNDDRSGIEHITDEENIDDVGFLERLANFTIEHYNVNAEHVFITGFSNGGMMTMRMSRESSVFKSFAPVGASMPTEMQTMSLTYSVPMLFIFGNTDPRMPYDGGPLNVPGPYAGTIAAFEDTLSWYATQNTLPGTYVETALPDADPTDGTTSIRREYDNYSNQDALSAIIIDGGGHTWPQGGTSGPGAGAMAMDFNACDTIWAFFLDYMLATSS